MDILAAVKLKLADLSYDTAEQDAQAIEFNINKARHIILAKINRTEIPQGLFEVWVDMAAGLFLACKKSTGTLGESFDFSAPVKKISEGDTSVDFAIADSGTFENQFEAMLNKMINPDAEIFLAYRKLVW